MGHTFSSGRHLLAPADRRDELRRASHAWQSWSLSGPPLTALESMLAGFLWPLRGYATPGSPPLVEPGEQLPASLALHLDLPADLGRSLPAGEQLALRDPEGVLLAALRVEHRTEGPERWWVGGPVEGVEVPVHLDFTQLRLAPAAIAERVRALGHRQVLAYVAGDALHAAHRAGLEAAARRADAAILLLIGSQASEHDELADFAAVRALAISAGHLPPERTVIAVVPFPRPAPGVATRLRAALIARNAGASHLALDESETGPEELAAVRAFGAAHALEVVPLRPWRYSAALGRLIDPESAADQAVAPPPAARVLADPASAPEWLLRAEEREALGRAHVPRVSRGFTVFFTGLSGSGKSTIARALRIRLMELTGRPVTLLDGDRVRRHLSSELGFSREQRILNVRRIGWVAAEISRHGGIAICAPIAPYDEVRREVRQMVEPAAGFLLVHVATPLETCEARDRKGLYARARAGLVPQFTGISDVYEPPSDAAVTIDTRDTSVEAACARIVEALVSLGYLAHQS